MERLGRRTSTAFRTTVDTEMSLAQRKLENRPSPFWFLKQIFPATLLTGATVATLTITLDDLLATEYHAPTLSYHPDGIANFGQAGVIQIPRVMEGDLIVGEERTGAPEAWALLAGIFDLGIYPAADKDYTLNFQAYARALRSVWLTHAPELLIASTGKTVARLLLQNSALAQEFAAEEAEAIDGLLRRQTALEIDELELIKGGD